MIAHLTKTKEADLEKAINDEKEVDFAIADELTVLDKTELEARDKQQKDDGIKAGKEIGRKEVREAAGLDEKIGKDPAKIAEAISKKAVDDAKVAPDKKVAELTEQVNLLQAKVSEKDTEIANSKKVASEAALDRRILAAFPKERIEGMEDEDFLTIIKRNHSFEEEDGKMVVKKDGQIIRDTKTTNPLGMKEAVEKIFADKKWNKEATPAGGGRGAGDQGGSGGVFKKRSEVIAHYEAQGKSIQGEHSGEIVAKLGELAKADPTFDMNN